MALTNNDALIREYLHTGDLDIRDQIVAAYIPLVEFIARKLSFNRDDFDDLRQIGTIGLVRSLDRFDPNKDVEFSTYASPNIIGEIKHYFRDKRGIVKVPRKLQEQHSVIKKYIKETQVEGKSPTVSQIAKALDLTEEAVIESMEAWQAGTVLSLDAPSYSGGSRTDDSKQSLLDILGGEHAEDTMLDQITIREAMRKLGHRERKIVFLRFYRGLSQNEIADRLNLSQMHISRLLTSSLKKLRHTLDRH